MRLEIPYLKYPSNNMKSLADEMGGLEYHHIEHSPWGETNPSPSVRFKIAHGNHAIFLLYDVWEPETLARFTKHNDPVHRDSCVEFFITFENKKNYYNLEFNCLGTCLAGWGSHRDNRELLPLEIISQIKTRTEINRNDTDKMPLLHWQLTLKIPLTVFVRSNVIQLLGQKATANFYKCGDDLSQPHFMSWNNIKTPIPDFHQPSFFGKLTFM